MGIPVANKRNPASRAGRSAWVKKKRKKGPRFAVWGGRMNLRRAGGTAAQAALQASSYRGMHTTQRRDSLRVKRWLKRASEPSRAKQGAQTPWRSYFSRGRESRSSPALYETRPGTGTILSRHDPRFIERERQVEHPFELAGAG